VIQCAICEKTGVSNLFACSACKGLFYCSKEHQKEHWPLHKSICSKIQGCKKNGHGVIAETLKQGEEGKYPPNGSKVKVNYIGMFPDGKIFDQSSEPFEFTLGVGKVIRGWDEGIAKMTKSEKAKLYISPEYGYGSRGAPPTIPPNSPLIFEVELLNFE